MKGQHLVEKLKNIIIESCPEADKRTNIAPVDLIIRLIVGLSGNNNALSFESTRRDLILQTGTPISRSAFWERLSTNRLFQILVDIFARMTCLLSKKTKCDDTLLQALGVEGISLFDASIVTLPEKAKKDFSGTFTESGLKLHLEMDAQNANFNWAALTPANVHDSVCLPELSTLTGRLSIFDLGYYDLSNYKDLDDRNGFFLSRAKINCCITIDEIVQGIGKQHTGGNLKDIKFKKKRSEIIEFWSIKEVDGDDFRFRVLGFWNSEEKQYHWYITNLTCRAEMIYPLYRFRWQIELLFKASKSSLDMDQIPSGNRMIILNIFLSRMIAVLAAMMIRGIGKKNTDHEKTMYVSIQRAANVFVNLKSQLLDYFTSKCNFTKKRLIRSLELMFVEMVDPNYRNRKNTRASLDSLCLKN